MSYDSVQDELILLGDYVDRGPQSRQVVDQIMKLKERHSIIALKGNHDAMMVKALTNDIKEYDSHWIRNGGLQTLASYVDHVTTWDESELDWDVYHEAKVWVRNHYSHHLQFLDQLPLVYEIPGYVFVHAGINPDVPDWRKQPESDFMWIREPFYSRPTAIEETVVFGHTPVKYLHDEMGIWFASTGDKIGIDGGCAYGAQLNMLMIREDGSLQTFFVKKAENPEDAEDVDL